LVASRGVRGFGFGDNGGVADAGGFGIQRFRGDVDFLSPTDDAGGGVNTPLVTVAGYYFARFIGRRVGSHSLVTLGMVRVSLPILSISGGKGGIVVHQ
jgi:hypothetical protein